MKRQTITLNNIDFELAGQIARPRNISTLNIDDCYNRPSLTKEAIWSDWRHWFIQNGNYDFGVCSYNCNFFSIEGIVSTEDGDYYVYITYAHNRAYKIDHSLAN